MFGKVDLLRKWKEEFGQDLVLESKLNAADVLSQHVPGDVRCSGYYDQSIGVLQMLNKAASFSSRQISDSLYSRFLEFRFNKQNDSPIRYSCANCTSSRYHGYSFHRWYEHLASSLKAT